jgi:hypothetical protein
MLPVVLAAAGAWNTSSFTHDFATAGSAYWGDFGYSLLTAPQARFVASNYRVVSLEKCTGRQSGVPTEAAIAQTAAQLKALNPNVKVLFYWSFSQAGISCYGAHRRFAAHPEWWLRDDHGNVVRPDAPQIDVLNGDAVAWWLSVPLAPSLRDIDGVLADGAGFEHIGGVSGARLRALYAAKIALLSTLQARLEPRGGMVLANGLSEYGLNPADPHNARLVGAAGGVQSEHYAAFEQIDPVSGGLRLDKVADALMRMERAAKETAVFASFWAGPYTGFSTLPGPGKGWPEYANGTQPCGAAQRNCTTADLYTGWRAKLQQYLEFNLASFLLIASPTSFFTQAVWYELHQGFVPCPEAPDACALPEDFYPLLKKPLGRPLGERVAMGAYRWSRRFTHANVSVDLEDPLGGSRVVFDS